MGLLRTGGLLALWLVASAASAQFSITYQAIDLADPSPGVDRWRYEYHVSGSFSQFSGFNLLFDETLFVDLTENVATPNASWTTLVIQPETGLGAAGVLNALATVPSAPTDGIFSIGFTFLGASPPGSQPFEIFDPSFNVIANGSTQLIPEPATAALMAAGLGLLILYARRRKSRS